MKNILLRIFMVLVFALESFARAPGAPSPDPQATQATEAIAVAEKAVLPLSMEDYDVVLGDAKDGVEPFRLDRAPYTTENFLKFQALDEEQKRQFLRNRRASLTKTYWLLNRTSVFVAMGSMTKGRMSATYQVTKDQWQEFAKYLKNWREFGTYFKNWRERGSKESPPTFEEGTEPNIIEMARLIEEENGQSPNELQIRYAPVPQLRLTERIKLRAQQIQREIILAKDQSLWSDPNLFIDMDETGVFFGFCAVAIAGGCNLVKGGGLSYAFKIVYKGSTQEIKFMTYRTDYKPTFGVVPAFYVALAPTFGVSRSINEFGEQAPAKDIEGQHSGRKPVRTGTSVALPVVPGFINKYPNGYDTGSNYSPLAFPSVAGFDPFSYVAQAKQTNGKTGSLSVAKPIAAVRAPIEYCLRLLKRK